MKIIEYTLGIVPYRRGGLPRYSTDLSDELAKENDVYVLYPGRIKLLNSKSVSVHIRKTSHKFNLVEMMNPLPVSLGLGIHSAASFMASRNVTKLIKFIKEVNPDVIHFHTLMGFPMGALKEIKELGIKPVFTTHDFYGFCPKMLEDNARIKLKSRKCSYDCMLCKDGPTDKKLFIMQSRIYEILKNTSLVKKIRRNQKSVLNKEQVDEDFLDGEEVSARYNLRIYYQEMYNLIDEFHYNSTVARDYIMRFLPDAKGKVVNITHSGLKDNRKAKKYHINDKMKIAYIGPYDEKKGFYSLIKCLKSVRKEYTNFQVYFYGDVGYHGFFKNSWVHNRGVQSEKDMLKAYKNIDLLIVPSLWHEPFGFVALEATLEGIPVLVSNNVGAKDILSNENIFEDNSALMIKLEELLSDGLTKLRENTQRLTLMYAMDEHSKKICDSFYSKKRRDKIATIK